MKTLLLLTAFCLFLIGEFVCPTCATWEVETALESMVRSQNAADIKRILETGVGRSYNIVWRSRMVADHRRKSSPQIPAENEWLWRWDRMRPSTIFPIGFIATINLKFIMSDSTPNLATNLKEYVAKNVPSVFVSTTRSTWAPRSRSHSFRYDIFAPGGIDVNLSLGQHEWQNQMEIAFVGGIIRDYIYGAVELDENQIQKSYHINPFYRGPANPLANRKTCKNLPVVTYDQPPVAQGHVSTVKRSLTKKKFCFAAEMMRTDGIILPTEPSCSL